MTDRPEIVFASLSSTLEPVTAVLVAEDLAIAESGRRLNQATHGALMRAAEAAEFKGKTKTALELLGQENAPKRLIVVGVGRTQDTKDKDWLALGGFIYGQIAGRKTQTASIIAEVADPGSRSPAQIAADIAAGALLRSYRFAKYLTKKPEPVPNGEAPQPEALSRIVVHTSDPDGARQAFVRHQAVAEGIFLARDLVNEPANVLGPVEFAERCRALSGIGVEVEILDADAMKALGMNCLLGVAQGSDKPARAVVMQWHGAKAKRSKPKPLCFIGKGVCFDTGGISIKPAAGMEDMKGDMAGAATVVGLMHALAARRATVSAVGIIGLVENMPSSNAQRPGDIVKSMSGQTVEVLNTDAEGRLVLADLMTYAQERFRPKLIVDLATLTGAILVALGKEYAGLFATDDKLAQDLIAAGEATGERVWRMPLDRAYDKLLDSKNADMKNIGGRHAGSITAAHFIGRFVKGTPWAHLDVAGVAMDSNKTDTNQGWASGWGVRLLDRFVNDQHEK